MSATTRESPLWNPLPGMIVRFPRPYSGREEYAHVLGVQTESTPNGARATVVAYLPAIFPEPTDAGPIVPPQWGRRPQYVKLSQWRRVIPLVHQLPYDWEPTQLGQPDRTVRLSAQACDALYGCLARLETHMTDEERALLEKFLPTKQDDQ